MGGGMGLQFILHMGQGIRDVTVNRSSKRISLINVCGRNKENSGFFQNISQN